MTTRRPTSATRSGAAHAGGGQRVTYSTSSGARGSFSCGSGSCTQTTGALPVGSQTITVTTCNSANLCQTSGGASISPYGATQGVPNLRVSNKDGNSITFSWGTTASNGRPITGYEIDGDRNQTVGAGTHSTTFNNLGYSTDARPSGCAPSPRTPGPDRGRPRSPARPTRSRRRRPCRSPCSAAASARRPAHPRRAARARTASGSPTPWATSSLPSAAPSRGGPTPTTAPAAPTSRRTASTSRTSSTASPQGSVTVTCHGADGRQKSDTKNPWGG